ncbi:MAG: VIT1/CCC1 transporter family protein [Candidatus Diapherotrites archaeon]|nr:VIT1/CCC1 transporter family protein [Candidatus Diapherotrites archaeon]
MAAANAFEWRARDVRELQANYVDEVSSQWLYEALAAMDKDAARAALLRSLASFEEKHAGHWRELLDELRQAVPARQRMVEHQVLALLARLAGVRAVLPLLHKAEVDGIARYKDQASRWKDERAQALFKQLLPEEVSHEVELFDQLQETGRSAGVLRSMILGANDGLGSTLALVAGVAGASQATAPVLIAGTAGLIAGAVSMAASNYISVKAEQEVFESRAGLQREAIAFALEDKKEQLRRAYLAKGFTEAEARTVTERLARSPAEFVKALLTEQQGIGEASFDSPRRLAAYTGFAFAVAGMVPVLPFALLPLPSALPASIAFTCLALFLAGALRTLVTLRSFFRSGLEMTLVGLGAATVTYLVGLWLGVVIG